MVKLLAEFIGIVGLSCSVLSFQCKKRDMVVYFQIAASLLFSIQLFMVGAVTGGCLDLISFVRNLIFANNSKKWASSPLWLGLFVVILVATGIATYSNVYSILPIIGSVLSTVALWMKKSKHIRLISLFVGPCWLIYNIINGAYSGALNELISMTSIIIGIIRCDINKGDKNLQTEGKSI